MHTTAHVRVQRRASKIERRATLTEDNESGAYGQSTVVIVTSPREALRGRAFPCRPTGNGDGRCLDIAQRAHWPNREIADCFGDVSQRTCTAHTLPTRLAVHVLRRDHPTTTTVNQRASLELFDS